MDSGETASIAVRREFSEEALNSLMLKKADKENILEKLEKIWETGVKLHEGYMDDERNTDNAWIETTCYSFHDSHGYSHILSLMAGDDAVEVKWTP